MALVSYSDSEGSEDESAPAPVSASAKPTAKSSDKPAFQKITNASEPRKIKVDLPTVKPESGQQEDQQPPAKRARTAGAFGGFNSLLPAPKRAAQAAPKAGVSLKTSSEAAFSRAPPPESDDMNGDGDDAGDGVNGNESGPTDIATVTKEEPKIVGKATKFKPLSVSNKKKPAKKSKPPDGTKDTLNDQPPLASTIESVKKAPKEAGPAPPEPKRSLFSVPQAQEEVAAQTSLESYEPMTTNEDPESADIHQRQQQPAPTAPTPSNADSLQSVASDLNLTAAQRRQLFGRNNKNQDINITHFNLDNEYAANEQLRQAGETVEHRAVKAIAPGKHSLQQLVNNARTQQDGLEDKWAAGRQARGEGGSKYGWGR